MEVTGDPGKGVICKKGSHYIQEKLSVGEVYLLQVPEGTEALNNSFVFFIVMRSLAPRPTEV